MKTFKNLLTALLLMCTAVATAHNFEVGGIYYNILSSANKTVAVTFKGTYYSEYSNEYTGCVVIPERVTYNGTTYSVTSIGDDTFDSCTGLTSIEIPNGVTSIGNYAFFNCDGLTSVIIPGSVTSIRNEAFGGCASLAAIHISDIVAWFDIDFSSASLYNAHNLYLNGEKITNLVVPNNVTRIRDYAFCGCEGLTSVVIPNGVASIGADAFRNCSSLKELRIEDGEDTLSFGRLNNGGTYNTYYLFENCPLETLYLGRNLSDNVYSFRSKRELKSVTIGKNVTSMVYGAFKECIGIKKVELYCETIGDWFCDNSSIEEIVIGNSVASIVNYAFDGCTSLTSVTSLIPTDNLFEPGRYAFNGVDKDQCTLYVPYGSKETYASTAGWDEFANIVELEPTETATEVTITINQYGSATYCSPYALDFCNVDGLKAYAATGYNKVTQVVTLTRLQTSQEGTGLFLKAEPGEYTVPVIECSNDYTLNLLVGTLEQTTVNSTDGAMSNYKFTIADGDEAPLFYPFEDNTPFNAGEAYLQIPTAWLPASASKTIDIRFDEGEFTDIDEVEDGLEGEDGEGKTIYDLQGRVVENPTNGIYIIDGKKVLVK